MAINTVTEMMAVKEPGPSLAAETKSADGDTAKFADSLKEAGGGQKPAEPRDLKKKEAPALDEDESPKKLSNEAEEVMQAVLPAFFPEAQAEEVCAKEVEATLLVADATEAATETVMSVPAESAESAGQAEIPGMLPQEKTPQPQQSVQAPVEQDDGTKEQAQDAPVHGEIVPDEAEDFAQEALREVKYQLAQTKAQATGQTKETPQTAGDHVADTKMAEDSTDHNGASGSDGRQLKETIKSMDPGEEPKAPEVQKAAEPFEAVKTAVLQPQETAEGAAPKSFKAVAGENMFAKIVSQVTAAARDGQSELHVKLKPDYLGGLSISLTMGEDGLNAKILTDRQSVQNMLRSDMTELQAALREKGIEVANLEVAYEANTQTTDQNASGQRGEQETAMRGGPALSETSPEEAANFYYTVSSYEVLAEHGGSVEFSA